MATVDINMVVVLAFGHSLKLSVEKKSDGLTPAYCFISFFTDTASLLFVLYTIHRLFKGGGHHMTAAQK